MKYEYGNNGGVYSFITALDNTYPSISETRKHRCNSEWVMISIKTVHIDIQS